MSSAVSAIVLLVFVLFIWALSFFLRGSARNVNIVPYVGKVIFFVKMTIEYWGLKKEYTHWTNVVAKSIILSQLLSVDGKDMRKARKDIRNMLQEVHQLTHPGQPIDDLDMDTAVGFYMILISHKEIAAIVDSIYKGTDELDVRSATNLAIDVFGEFVNLKTKLGQQYFQHLIFGINKALMLIKTKGTDKKTLKEVVSVLYRVYKLTKAYRHQVGLQNLTEAEFYEKAFNLFRRFDSLVVSDKA